MADYIPRVKNSELLRCMLALCLDEGNIYRCLFRNLKGSGKDDLKKALAVNPADSNHETSLVFGITPNTLSDTVLLPSKKFVNRSTLINLVNATRRFRDAYTALMPNNDLKHLKPLIWDDFDPEVIQHVDREEHFYSFAEKLGFCKRICQGGSLILNNGEVVLDKMSVIKAVDRNKNTANKPGCGVNISLPFAKKLFDRYHGVYALYYPAGYRHAGKQGFIMAAMRVSHTLEQNNKTCSVIRVKLNIPNVSCEAARYQYRGFLTPVGNKDHLHLTFYLATNTINREQYQSEKPPLDPDTVNIICTKMIGIDRVFFGVLTSLSQREPGYSRQPYASKVLIKRQEFNGSSQQVHDDEGRFMRSEGLGYFGSLDDMLTRIADRSEAPFVEKYFGGANCEPDSIYSEPIV